MGGIYTNWENHDIESMKGLLDQEHPSKMTKQADAWWKLRDLFEWQERNLNDQHIMLSQSWKSGGGKFYLEQVKRMANLAEDSKNKSQGNYDALWLMADDLKSAQHKMDGIWKRYKAAMKSHNADVAKYDRQMKDKHNHDGIGDTIGDWWNTPDKPKSKSAVKEPFNKEARKVMSDLATKYDQQFMQNMYMLPAYTGPTDARKPYNPGGGLPPGGGSPSGGGYPPIGGGGVPAPPPHGAPTPPGQPPYIEHPVPPPGNPAPPPQGPILTGGPPPAPPAPPAPTPVPPGPTPGPGPGPVPPGPVPPKLPPPRRGPLPPRDPFPPREPIPREPLPPRGPIPREPLPPGGGPGAPKGPLPPRRPPVLGGRDLPPGGGRPTPPGGGRKLPPPNGRVLGGGGKRPPTPPAEREVPRAPGGRPNPPTRPVLGNPAKSRSPEGGIRNGMPPRGAPGPGGKTGGRPPLRESGSVLGGRQAPSAREEPSRGIRPKLGLGSEENAPGRGNGRVLGTGRQSADRAFVGSSGKGRKRDRDQRKDPSGVTDEELFEVDDAGDGVITPDEQPEQFRSGPAIGR